MNKKLILTSILLMPLLTSCGGQKASYRAYEKQVTPSDIKISSLDLASSTIEMRFEYRSYRDKILEDIQCDIEFNSQHQVSLSQQLSITLDAFSTEILHFTGINISQHQKLLNLKTIGYSQVCRLEFKKGSEIVRTQSVLHLRPGSEFKYR